MVNAPEGLNQVILRKVKRFRSFPIGVLSPTLPFGWESPMTNSQISSKWQPEKLALPTLYKSLANTIKRHLHFLPNDDSYNIQLKSLIVSSRGWNFWSCLTQQQSYFPASMQRCSAVCFKPKRSHSRLKSAGWKDWNSMPRVGGFSAGIYPSWSEKFMWLEQGCQEATWKKLAKEN